MRIVKDPDTRKEEILQGALRVFARKGYDKTTITDISKELGISQGLCYRYYASKEEIYDAAVETYANHIVSANLERFSNNGKTLKEKIIAYSGGLKEYKKIEQNDELLYQFFHSENGHKMHDQLMMNVSFKLGPKIKNILDAYKKNGEIKIDDTGTFAYFLVFGQLGILLAEGDNSDTQKKIQKTLIEILDL